LQFWQQSYIDTDLPLKVNVRLPKLSFFTGLHQGTLANMLIDRLLDNVLRYIESRFELFKVEVEESIAGAMIRLIRGMIVGVFGLMVVIFFSWGLANVINVWLNSRFAGYFIVGGLYGLAMLGILSKPGERMLQERIEQAVQKAFEKRKKTDTSKADVQTKV